MGKNMAGIIVVIAYANLGAYYLGSNELSKARQCWKKVLEFNPGFTDAIAVLDEIDKKEQLTRAEGEG